MRGITAIFADGKVGLEIIAFMLDTHPDHLRCVVTTGDNDIAQLARTKGLPVHYYDDVLDGKADDILPGVQYIFLAWWPKIIPASVFNAATIGTINLHPSYLPYNRGKNYNFWTIVEDSPFGVSMHFVDSGIDSGDIIFQQAIEKTWQDTGGSLYSKAQRAITQLFRTRYMDLVEGRFLRTAQPAGRGSLHYEKELEPASEIFLEKQYPAKTLLNLLRARTFEGKPACYFFEGEKKYEIRISIIEVEQ